MIGLRPAKLYTSFSPTSPSFGPRSTSTGAVTENPTLNPTLSPKSPPKNLGLIITLCTVIPVLLFCVWYLGRRYVAKRRATTKSILFPKTTKGKVVTEGKRVSGQSSAISSSHYLNPLTKKSTIPSEQEYFLMDSDLSR